VTFLSGLLEIFARMQGDRISHSDIKPENILIFDEKQLHFKICDVGSVKSF